MARRLYLGRLPTDARAEEVSKFFEGYGRIIDCRVMTGFGFIEFENNRDAEEAVSNFNGKNFMGQPIVVEFAKESTRPKREYNPDYDRNYNGGAYPVPRPRRPPGVRLVVAGISRDTSWQDLKDFGREAGSVSYADIDRDNPGHGILEYQTREDADNAVKVLDGKELRGQSVRVSLSLSDERVGIPERTGGGGGGGGGRDERYRDDRGPRPHRSRSPPRREYYDRDRRARSPPPQRRERSPPREYDERRPVDYDRRYEDRRVPPPEFDRRRERDDRRDDRRPSNGDGGWAGGRPY